MNKIYKTIWSQVRQCYVVVSEIAKREGKSKTGQGRRALSALVLSFVLAGGISFFPAQGIEAGFIGDYEDNDEAYWNNGGAMQTPDYGTFGVRWGGGNGPNQRKLKFRYGLITGEDYSRGNLPTYNGVNGYIKYRTAIGNKFQVWGDGATAFGYNTRAYGFDTLAIGHNANVKDSYAIAIGADSESGGNGTTAIGVNSKAQGQDAIALGNQSVAINDQSVTLGAKSMAVEQATAIGTDVYAMGQGSVAIGGDDTTQGSEFTDKLPEATIERLYSKLWDPAAPYHPFKGDDYGKSEFRGKYINGNNRIYSPTYTGGVGSIAIGVRSIAAKDGSTAMGVLSMALGKHSTAMGTRSMVAENAEGGLAVGEETRVLSSHGVAIGNQTYSDQNGSVAYGYNSKAVGEGAMALGRYVGANAELTDESRKNLKSMLTVRVDKNVEEQYKRYDTTEKRLEYLSKNKAEYKENKDRILRTYQKDGRDVTEYAIQQSKEGDKLTNNAIVIGRNSYATGDNSLLLGAMSFASGRNSMAIGPMTYSEGKNSAAIGMEAIAQATNSMALGVKSHANIENSIAIGVESKTDYTVEDLKKPGWAPRNAITFPSSSRVGIVSVGSIGSERRITNVASGYRDTDAVNVAQLRSLEDRISTQFSEDGGDSPFSYLSVEKAKGDAGKMRKLNQKEYNYRKYVQYRTKQLELEVKEALGETIDEDFKNEIASTIQEIERDEGNKAGIEASGLKGMTGAGLKDQFAQAHPELKNDLNKLAHGISNELSKKKQELLVDPLRKALTQEEWDFLNKTNYLSNGATGKDSVSFGYHAHSAGDQSVALGKESVVKKGVSDGIALGAGAVADRKAGTFAWDFKNDKAFTNDGEVTKEHTKLASGKSGKGALSIGAGDGTRQITGVAGGTEDTDAVNVAQLKQVSAKIDNAGGNVTNLLKKIEGNTTNINNITKKLTNGFKVKGKTGESTINLNGDSAPTLSFTGDKYITTNANNGAVTFSIDETELNKQIHSQITNNSTVTGKMTSWKLKAAGDRKEEEIKDGNTVTFDVETANEGLTVKREGKTIKYGIDGEKLASNVITNINDNSSAITNISAKFSVSDGTNTKAVNLGKNKNNSVKFVGETDKIDVSVSGNDDAPTVTVKANAKLGESIDISKNTSITNLTKKLTAGFKVKGKTGESTINLNGDSAPTLSFTGDKYITTNANNGAVTFSIDETELNKQINSQITNNSTVTGKMTSWKLKATGDTAEEEIKDGNTVTFDVETANEGLTVKREGKTIKYGIDGEKLASNVITNINDNSSAITNISATFSISGKDNANKQEMTLSKTSKPNIQFLGEENKIDVEVGGSATAPTVTVKANAKLGENIDISNNKSIKKIEGDITTTNTNVTNLTKKLTAGFKVKGGTGEGTVNLNGDTAPTLEFAGDDNLTTKVDGTKVTYSLNKTGLTSTLGDTFAKVDATNVDGGNLVKWQEKLGIRKAGDTNYTDVSTTINNLKGGFTIKDSGSGTVDIGLGETTKSAITFKTAISEDENSADVFTATVDGEKNVTYTINAKKLKEKMGLTKGVGSMSSWTLKANSDIEGATISDSTTVTFDVAEANKGLTVKREGNTIKYGIDGEKLASNVITNINNNDNAITNISATFSISGKDNANKKDMTLSKTSKPNIQFLGEENKIDVEVGGSATAPTVTVKANAKLGENIDISNNKSIKKIEGDINTTNTNVTNLTKKLTAGFKVKGGTGEGTVNLNGDTAPTLEFAGDDNLTTKVDGTKVTYSLNKTGLTSTLGDTFAKVDATNVDGGNLVKWQEKLGIRKAGDTNYTDVSTTINNLKGGFTIKDSSTGTVDIGLGETTKSAITFKTAISEDENSADVFTATVDGEKNVTYTINAKKLKEKMGLTQGVGSMSSWTLKANSDIEGATISDSTTVTFDVAEADKGLTVARDGNTIKYGIDKEKLLDDGFTVGKNGADGKDGTIGVNGKDGHSVVINGKDGSIGLNGKDGANGLSIRGIDGDKGETGAPGVNGESITRLVITEKDGKNPRQVATLDDGLKFKGDETGDAVGVKLNQLVTIQGGAKADNITEGNISVVAAKTNDGGVTYDVKLAKKLAGVESITFATTTGQPALTIDGTGRTIKGLSNTTWPTDTTTNFDESQAATQGQLKKLLDDGFTVGKNGADGKDGTIGVNGKDGHSVVINGKDGSIGLNGKDGTDGLSIRGIDGAKGETGATGVNGEFITRLVITEKDGKNPRQVATLDDGLKFKGDETGDAVGVKLNQLVTIQGGAKADNITEGNISVVAAKTNDGGVTYDVKLAKKLAGVESITFATTTGQPALTIDGTGRTIKGLSNTTWPTDTTKNFDESLAATQGQLKSLETKITNSAGSKTDFALVKAGTTKTAEGTTDYKIDENGKINLLVQDQAHKDTIKTITIADVAKKSTVDKLLNEGFTVGKKGADGVDGKDGTIGVNGKDGHSVVINGKDGSIGLNGKDGTDGLSIRGMDGAKGETGATGVNGESITRLVITKKDGTDPHQVATLDDGLKFVGDNKNKVLAKKLNSTLKIYGNGTASKDEDTTEGNITVKGTDDGLQIRMLKNLTNMGSILFATPDGTPALHIDGKKRVITGLANTTWDISKVNDMDDSQAATQGQLKSLFDSGLTVGKNGADGKDGTIGVNGKDGHSVVINGKDGSIGLNGKDGKDGLSIRGMDGKAGDPGVNGESITRLVITDKDGKNPHQVATLDDGLKFKGDGDGDAVGVKLNKTVEIKGGATGDTSENNISVVAKKTDDGGVTYNVKLAKELKGLTSVETKSDKGTTVQNGEGLATTDKDGKNTTKVTATDISTSDKEGNKTTVNKDGVTILAKGKDGKDTTVSLTKEGLNNGGKKITHIADGEADDDAATVKQMNAMKKDLTEKLDKVGGFSVEGPDNKATEMKGDKKLRFEGDDKVEVSVTAETITDPTTKETKTTAKVKVGLKNDLVLGSDKDSGSLTLKQSAGGKLQGELKLTNGAGSSDLAGNPSQRLFLQGTPAGGKTTSSEVATLNDGFIIGGDIGAQKGNPINVKAKLNKEIAITGGITDVNKLTDDNIGVVADGSGLKVKLAKDIKGINSISSKHATFENAKITNAEIENVTFSKSIQVGKVKLKEDTVIIKGGVEIRGKSITNVAEGKVSEDSTDAVNGKQLYRTNKEIEGVGKEVVRVKRRLESEVERVENRMSHTGAGAAALAALQPLDFDGEHKWDISAGYGNYKGAHALALGAYYRPNERTIFTLGTSLGGGENMINAGVSFKMGPGEVFTTSPLAMARELNEMKKREVMYDALMKGQQQELDALKERDRKREAEIKALQEKDIQRDKEIQELRNMMKALQAKA